MYNYIIFRILQSTFFGDFFIYFLFIYYYYFYLIILLTFEIFYKIKYEQI